MKVTIFLVENPASDEDDYRLEVLIALRRIERLDKDEYNEDERQEAQEIYEQRRQEELQAEVYTYNPISFYQTHCNGLLKCNMNMVAYMWKLSLNFSTFWKAVQF